jgi:glycosyltransferase involved in cell wall biosynthesis
MNRPAGPDAIRVTHFTECYHPVVNGVVISVHTFVHELRRLGAQVAIIAPRFPGYKDSEPDVYRLPSVTFPVEPVYPLALPFLRRVSRIMDHVRPQVIHTHAPFLTGPLGRRAARKRKVPLVFTFHTRYEDYAHYVAIIPLPLARLAARKLSRAYADSCDCVIAPSSGLKQILLSDGVRAPVEVVPTGVVLDMAEPQRLAPIRNRWAIPSDAPLFLYAGRLGKEKNLQGLLEAFARISERRPDAHLLIAGGGPWFEPAKRLAAVLGLQSHVHFAGMLPREEVFRCNAEAVALLFSSLTDTQGVALLEAMAVGTPCVAMRSPAIVDVIREGENGIAVEPEPEAMARAALAVLEDKALRQKLSAGAKETAREFSSSRMAQKLLGIYRELTI